VAEKSGAGEQNWVITGDLFSKTNGIQNNKIHGHKCTTLRIQNRANGVRQGTLNVQRGQRNLPHLRLLEQTNHHRPEERHMERGVNTVIRGKL
jgi:hypothetical protein